MLPACEGADQHDQGGFRQMEICDQAVHRLKMITRINKNRSVVAAGVDDPVLIRRALNSAAAGRADADDAAACLVCAVDEVRGFLRHVVPLGMHGMLLHIVHLDRPEGT